MNFKELLKPTKRKVAVSAIVTIAFVLFLRNLGYIECNCIAPEGGSYEDLFRNCTDYYGYLPLPGRLCHCGCTPVTEVLSQYFWFLILPFAVIYLLYSLAAALLKSRTDKKIKKN